MVLGIDPGVRGGAAVLDVPTRGVVYLEGFRPGWPHEDLVDCVRRAIAAGAPITAAYIEKVGYMPGDGGKGANTFGRVDGILRGAVLMARVLVFSPTPQMWQAAMGCLSGGDKNVTKRRAQELFPAIADRITHAVADALLIAEFGRRHQIRLRG